MDIREFFARYASYGAWDPNDQGSGGVPRRQALVPKDVTDVVENLRQRMRAFRVCIVLVFCAQMVTALLVSNATTRLAFLFGEGAGVLALLQLAYQSSQDQTVLEMIAFWAKRDPTTAERLLEQYMRSRMPKPAASQSTNPTNPSEKDSE